ncbi:hypothetical protein ACVWZA_000548 [Sphingomonas sp. UYAg733]
MSAAIDSTKSRFCAGSAALNREASVPFAKTCRTTSPAGAKGGKCRSWRSSLSTMWAGAGRPMRRLGPAGQSLNVLQQQVEVGAVRVAPHGLQGMRAGPASVEGPVLAARRRVTDVASFEDRAEREREVATLRLDRVNHVDGGAMTSSRGSASITSRPSLRPLMRRSSMSAVVSAAATGVPLPTSWSRARPSGGQRAPRCPTETGLKWIAGANTQATAWP